MQSKNTYQNLIKKARNSRMVNIGLCAAGVVALAVGIVFALRTEFFLPAALGALLVLLALSAVFAKSLAETKAALRIADNAVYAAQLTAEQQRAIKKQQMRRGQIFYLAVLLIVVMPESAVLIGMYFYFQSTLYLLIMAVFALICLLCALVALAYLSARLSVKDSIFSISKHGVMFGREILPFSAKKKEALQLLKFQDYYFLLFVKTAVFGIKYESGIIFPTDGVVRKGLSGTPDEELVVALGLDGVFETEDAFYESRDYLTDDDTPEESAPPKPKKEKRQKQNKKDSEDKKATTKTGAKIYSESNAQATAVLEPVDDGADKKGLLE